MIINLDNALQVIGLAIVILLALIGLITLTVIIIHLTHEVDKCFDDPNDFYAGCDPQKVKANNNK